MEGCSDERIKHDAKKAGTNDRFFRVDSRVLEFTRVANGCFERVRRPACNEQRTEELRPSPVAPVTDRRHEREVILRVDAAVEEGNEANDQHRHDHKQADPHLHASGSENATMLNGECHQHQSRADEERRTDFDVDDAEERKVQKGQTAKRRRVDLRNGSNRDLGRFLDRLAVDRRRTGRGMKP